MERPLQELEQHVTNLSSKWMSTIGGEYHKDRDCHWYITRQWSYGEAPVWTAYHHGYLEAFPERKCASYREALTTLISWLEASIDNTSSWVDN